jgi:signal transduction histidine kinase/ligand-binding sensor domain-containing protein/ActR/RegA family two-component response regulator
MSIPRRFLFALLLAALGLPVQLAGQRYNFKFYGEEEGLQNLAVQVVLQDRAGFLWVGTQNGLFRYDGSRFTSFGRADGLPAGRIDSLHEAVDGTLWVGTDFGLARRQGQRFETVPLTPGGSTGVAGREAIASDSSGHLYVATRSGLAVGTKSPRGWEFKLAGPAAGHSAGEPASAVYVDSIGLVWYSCGSKDLCRLEGKHSLSSGPEGLPKDRWEAIIEDLEGNIWVRSENQLAVRSPATHRFQLRTPAAGGALAPATNTLPALALDPDGNLLVSTNRGLARQAGAGWETVGADQGLTTNDISTVEQDREGSIWIGLLGSGLARWLGYREWQSWNGNDGLSRESVWAAARDASGRLWVGTQAGLDYLDERPEENRSGGLPWRHQLAGLEIRALAAASDGTLWIGGGNGGGLRQLDPRNGSTRSFGPAQGLTNGSVLHLTADREGRIWASTRAGLFRSIAATSKGQVTGFEQVRLSGNGTTEHAAGVIANSGPVPPPVDAQNQQPAEGFLMTLQDSRGAVWACGDFGLARYAEGRWTRFTTNDGLKDNMVASVAEDVDGSIWVGYRDAYGVTHLTFPGSGAGDHPQVEHINSTNGLRSDKTLFLGRDRRGWLWVGTDHGMDVYDHARWRHFGHSDGLIWDDTNRNAFLAEPGGSIWIGTSRGLSRFQPRATPIPGVPPPVAFTSVKLGGQEVDPFNAKAVPYSQNSLQVQLAALTFVQESSVLFRYRLAQSEHNWVETRQRELNYVKLPPGQYTLEAMACNAQGIWSAEPARLHFEILTPWFLTWWFRIGSGLATLFFGHLLWRRRTHRLEVERQRLETKVAERTRELSQEKQRVFEEKARAEHENAVVQEQNKEIERLLAEARQTSRFKSEFLANMSHEIRTPMNGILGMTDLVLATELTTEQRECLETARISADSLLTILNDVLDFSKIEAGKLDLHPVAFSLRQYVHQTVKIFAVSAAEKRLDLGVQIADPTPDRLVGDPDRLQQVLLNLINNAIKFTSRGGVQVGTEYELTGKGEVIVHFSVRDTGIGIPADKQRIIFESFRQADGSTTRRFGGTGLGLAICSKLVEMMGGQIWVESDGASGSTFHFTARFLLDGNEASAPFKVDSLRQLLNAAGAGTPGLRILLAEDNPINQKLATRLLERRGHHVVPAVTGRQALELHARESFHVILMDVQMPDMDGLETTRAIRALEQSGWARTPIVALTAHTMKGDRERCLAAGMDAFITKPIDSVALLSVVEELGNALAATDGFHGGIRNPTEISSEQIPRGS